MKINEVIYKKPSEIERFIQHHSILKKHGIDPRDIDIDKIKGAAEKNASNNATQASPSGDVSAQVKEKPGFIPFLDFNGQRMFYHQQQDRWYYYHGQAWPNDIKATHPVEDEKSDAIAGLVASGQVKYAPWKPPKAAGAATNTPRPRKPLRPARPAAGSRVR